MLGFATILAILKLSDVLSTTQKKGVAYLGREDPDKNKYKKRATEILD